MEKRIGLLAMLLIIVAFSISCRKETPITTDQTAATTATTPPPTVPSVPVTPTAPTHRTLNQGTGSGTVTIDGSKLALQCNDVIKIKTGSYTSLVAQNINIGCPVTIQNDSLVQFVGNSLHFQITNVSNLTISGAGTPSISKGFVSRDNPYRSVVITGSTHSLTMQNISFSNIGDYTVYVDNGNTVYDGSQKSYTDSLKFLNIDCNNTETFLQINGNATAGQVTGLVKHLEIAGLNFTNSPNCGSVVAVGMADSYNIHNNTVTNINSTNNNHNGIFFMKGNGSFHNNLVRNHQGNALRGWIYSLGTTPETVTIYNNTVVESRKYSAFEVQSFADQMIPGKTTFANAKIYSNICGDLNLTKDWYGVIVDVYDLFGGAVDVYNNTAFELPAPNPSSNFVNVQNSTIPTVTNNTYYATAAAAGIPDINQLTIQP